jgi:hypothetical protein
LSFFFFFLTRGRPFDVVHDLFPLALRGVERRGDRFLAVGVVARDVEELASRAGHAAPESWMRDVHVVPFWNAEMTSLSVALGSSVQRLEKRRMYSRRVSPDCCLQFRSSHYLLGRM